jgi:type I restriction enzyme S subunit
VDFEFPDKNGLPYKSNNGKMVWCEELEKEIPEGWELTELKNIIENFDSKRKPITGSDRISVLKSYPYYGAASLMDYIDDFIFDGEYILMGEDGSVITENGTPVLQYVWGKFWVNNHAHVLKGTNGFNENSLYVLLKNTNVTDIITGGVQLKINQTNLNSLKIIKPTSVFLNEFNKILNPIFNLFKSKKTENQKLKDLKDLLLARMTRVN